MESPGKHSPEAMRTPSSTASEWKGVPVTPNEPRTVSKPSGVKEPHDNDVLCGRGGSINSHPGNERFRELVEKRKRVYLTARFKREKRLIANSIVSEIRALDPPGRFLSRDSKTGVWSDIGDEKARDKTSQALRENAPSIRAEIEVEINQQRAEMQRAEEEEAARATVPSAGPPHHYYQQPWGYYAPYHGYGQYHHSMPPSYSADPYASSWHHQDGAPSTPSPRSPASLTSRRGGSHGHYTPSRERNARPPPEEPGSQSFDVPKFMSGWTKTSFSFGGYSSGSEGPEQPARASTPPPQPTHGNKPLVYIHNSSSHDLRPDSRRSVHFKDDRYGHRGHGYYRQHPGHHRPRRYEQPGSGYYHYGEEANPRHHPMEEGGMYSPIRQQQNYQVTPERQPKRPHSADEAMEPSSATPYEETGGDSSLLTQVANHLLGSWDASMSCTQDSTQDSIVVPPRRRLPSARHEHVAGASLADEILDEEEGQEVQLGETEYFNVQEPLMEETMDVDDEARMPPPPEESQMTTSSKERRRIEIDWSSKMLGCQSAWLPDTFNPPSFFTTKSNPLSPSASLELDGSAVGTEGMSCTGSIGGASLCQVFSNDQIAAEPAASSANHSDNVSQILSQIPSWERSFRSKSPSTICSDGSMTSKTSVKMDGHISPLVSPSSPK